MSKFQNLFKKNYCHSKKSRKTDTPCYVRLNIFICVFIIFAAITYLFQVNGLTNLGYKIQELESKANEIEAANDKLELQAAKLQSISNVQQAVVDLGLVEVNKITYINSNDFTIAAVK